MKLKATRLWIFAFGLLLLGCSPSKVADAPPEILYGEDICEECNMIISEPRFAAAYTTVDGQARRFDDIGGMCVHHLETQEEVASFWVHDYQTEEWLNAEEAFFVLGEGIYTPMAYGVVAFAERTDADSFATETDGLVLTFDHLMDHFSMGDTEHLHSDHGDEGHHPEHEKSGAEGEHMDHNE